MSNAAFLLLINVTIGVGFATLFATLAYRFRVRFGYWCAIGFVSASLTAVVELFARVIPYERLTSLMSFGALLVALSAICMGTWRHYRPSWPNWPVLMLPALFLGIHQLVLFDLPRDSIRHASLYQLPFALLTALGAIAILWKPGIRLRGHDIFLAAVLVTSSLQFLAKVPLARTISTGANVGSYAFSSYAHYSQAFGAILSILLGLSLLYVLTQTIFHNLRETMNRDPLSGLWNRRAFFENSETFLKARRDRTAWVMLCDLDHFKRINDTYGHGVGDEVIAGFSDCLRRSAGDGIAGRLGGEEFALVLHDATALDVQARVLSIRADFSSRRFSRDIQVSASFGVAPVDLAQSLEQAIGEADAALYQAKSNGRDRCHFSDAHQEGWARVTAIHDASASRRR